MSTVEPTGVFMRAEWRHLAMLSFEVDPDVLEPFLPPQLELDYWHGKTYLSLVGFVFQHARLFGISIPFHQSFPEINLRFYVVRRTNGVERRGVIFLREIAPKRCVGFIARRIYHESYLAFARPPCDRDCTIEGQTIAVRLFVAIRAPLEQPAYRHGRRPPCPPRPGFLDEFVVEHYWAYTRDATAAAGEYRVDHSPWQIRRATDFQLDCDGPTLYSPAIGAALEGSPQSAFVAEGSPVAVHRGIVVPASCAVAELVTIPAAQMIEAPLHDR